MHFSSFHFRFWSGHEWQEVCLAGMCCSYNIFLVSWTKWLMRNHIECAIADIFVLYDHFEGYCQIAFYWWSPPSCWGRKTWAYFDGMIHEFSLVYIATRIICKMFLLMIVFLCRRKKCEEIALCLTCFLWHSLILYLPTYFLLMIVVNSWQTKNELKLKNN